MKTFVASAVLAAVALSSPMAEAAIARFSDMPDSVIVNPLADIKVGRVEEGETGSRPKSRSPWQEEGPDTGVIYTDPGAFYTAVHKGASATYAVASSAMVSFAWGSPDGHNLVEFLRNGLVVDSYFITRATDIAPATFGRSGAQVVISSILGGSFDGLRFSSADDAFEFANLTVAPVPLPAGIVLLVTALGGLMVARRRRQDA